MTAPKQSETSDDRELVERLREKGADYREFHGLIAAGTVTYWDEAADRIEALLAEHDPWVAPDVDMLGQVLEQKGLLHVREKINRWFRSYTRAKDRALEETARADRAEAALADANTRIAAKDEALTTAFVAMKIASTLPSVDAEYDFTDAIDAARAALTPATEKEPGR